MKEARNLRVYELEDLQAEVSPLWRQNQEDPWGANPAMGVRTGVWLSLSLWKFLTWSSDSGKVGSKSSLLDNMALPGTWDFGVRNRKWKYVWKSKCRYSRIWSPAETQKGCDYLMLR